MFIIHINFYHRSPGFGLTLVAETTGGSFLAAELMSNPKGQDPTVPEDLGKNTAKLLMEEIYRVCLLLIMFKLFYVYISNPQTQVPCP